MKVGLFVNPGYPAEVINIPHLAPELNQRHVSQNMYEFE